MSYLTGTSVTYYWVVHYKTYTMWRFKFNRNEIGTMDLHLLPYFIFIFSVPVCKAVFGFFPSWKNLFADVKMSYKDIITCRMILVMQVISDSIVKNIVATLRNLQVLALCHCLGDISISGFKFSMPNLRKLQLELVTPWMTNNDLVILTQSCANLIELSLLGCKLLNSGEELFFAHHSFGTDHNFTHFNFYVTCMICILNMFKHL